MIAPTDIRWQAVLPLRSDDIQPPDLPTTQRVTPARESADIRMENSAFGNGPTVQTPFDPDAPTGPPPAFEANVLDAREESRSRPNFDMAVRDSTDHSDTQPGVDYRR